MANKKVQRMAFSSSGRLTARLVSCSFLRP